MLYIETNKYNRVLTTDYIPKGTLIIKFLGVLLSKPSRYSIQINENEHLHPISIDKLIMKQLVWPYLNHSCNPNAYIDTNTLQLISLINIEANKEITFDYESTEYHMSESFRCNCKKQNCRGMIRGKAFITSFS